MPATDARLGAIVVLGCRVLPSGRPTVAAARRARAGASAYRAGIAPWVVVSGGRRWGQQVEARVLRQELVRAGVPSAVIVEELCSLTTRENAVFAAAVLRRLGTRSAAIVTCDWHLPRALANFGALGIEAVPWPAETPRAVLLGLLRSGHEWIGRALDARRASRGRVLRQAADWASPCSSATPSSARPLGDRLVS